jgi:hypothetical protein
MHRNYMKRESTTPGSARASRARFGALAETRLISRSANQKQKFVASTRGARALPSTVPLCARNFHASRDVKPK